MLDWGQKSFIATSRKSLPFLHANDYNNADTFVITVGWFSMKTVKIKMTSIIFYINQTNHECTENLKRKELSLFSKFIKLVSTDKSSLAFAALEDGWEDSIHSFTLSSSLILKLNLKSVFSFPVISQLLGNKAVSLLLLDWFSRHRAVDWAALFLKKCDLLEEWASPDDSLTFLIAEK